MEAQEGAVTAQAGLLGILGIVAITTTASAQELEPTPNVGAGPNHKAGAPYRAKLSPPLAEGTVLLVRGHVRAADTGKAIAGVVLDAFQADARGKYDMEGFEYRARVLDPLETPSMRHVHAESVGQRHEIIL